ncbi:MAG TPA: hypothetical protein VLA43_15040, partial [Longimicrobiales bacterium]|nr:hypothetical protein [Longimicrobiales bacterium]
MQIPGSVTQVTDSVAGRLQGLPVVLPGLTVETQAKIIVSCLLVIFLIFARRLVLRVVDRKVQDRTTVYRWAKVSSYVATF